MKISAWHKSQGDHVEWWDGFKHYDRVYQSKVFDSTYTPDYEFCVSADEVIRGGTGYDLQNKLPEEIEHICPDYSLYGAKDTCYGFLTRGCPRGCNFCIVAKKEGRKSIAVSDTSEWYDGKPNIKLLDPNILACRDHMELLKQLADTKASVDITQGADCRMLTEDNINALNQVNISMLHFAWDLTEESGSVLCGLELYAKHGKLEERERRVYVLTNYNTTIDEDLYRIYKLRELHYDPYVMIYDKGNFVDGNGKLLPMTVLLQKYTLDQIRHFEVVHDMSRWVNNKFIWRSCSKFEDYA